MMTWIRHLFLSLIAVCIFLMPYSVMVFLPIDSFWYRPKVEMLQVTPTNYGEPVVVYYDHVVLQDISLSYATRIIRFNDDGQSEGVCTTNSGPPSELSADLRLPQVMDLQWWTDDASCSRLGPGYYVMKTCWTVHDIFYGVIPPKTICLESNVFEIRLPQEIADES